MNGEVRWGSPASLRLVAERADDFRSLLKCAVLHALAHPDGSAESAIASVSQDVEHLLNIQRIHLHGAADRLEQHESAQRRADNRAQVIIGSHLEGVQATAMKAPFDPVGYFVYCLWGVDDKRPLYVGMSTNILSRLGSHLGDRRKTAFIKRVTLLRCQTRKLMVSTEARLIGKYRPLWNVVGNREATSA